MDNSKTPSTNHDAGGCDPDVYGFMKIRPKTGQPPVTSSNVVVGPPVCSDSGPLKKTPTVRLVTKSRAVPSTTDANEAPIDIGTVPKKRKHVPTNEELAYNRRKTQLWRDRKKLEDEEKDRKIAELESVKANFNLVNADKENLLKANEDLKRQLADYQRFFAKFDLENKLDVLLANVDDIKSLLGGNDQSNTSHSHEAATNDHQNNAPTIPAVQSDNNTAYDPSDLPDDLASLSINDLPITRGEAIRLISISMEAQGNKEEFLRRIGDEDHQ